MMLLAGFELRKYNPNHYSKIFVESLSSVIVFLTSIKVILQIVQREWQCNNLRYLLTPNYKWEVFRELLFFMSSIEMVSHRYFIQLHSDSSAFRRYILPMLIRSVVLPDPQYASSDSCSSTVSSAANTLLFSLTNVRLPHKLFGLHHRS